MLKKIVKPIHDPHIEIVEWVWEYPKSPVIKPSSRHLQVVFNDIVIADTRYSYRCVEAGRAPVYFFPQYDVNSDIFTPTDNRTFFRHVGQVTAWDCSVGDATISNCIFSITHAELRAKKIANYFVFYPSPSFQITANSYFVPPSSIKNNFGWVTRDILGPFVTSPDSEVQIKLMHHLLKKRGQSVADIGVKLSHV